MRKTIPVVQCDRCQTDIPIETRSTIVEVTLPAQKPSRYAGENCAECKNKFIQAIVELLDEFLVEERKASPRAKVKSSTDESTSAETSSTRAERALAEYDKNGWSIVDRTCKRCGHTAASRGALGQHLWGKHQTSLAEEDMLETFAHRKERRARIGKS
jgi:hypothetical protein